MGRPKGSKNKKTLEREKALAEQQGVVTSVLYDTITDGPKVDQTDSILADSAGEV
jgi:hypothetical protein